jgi:predicted DNA-binding transcriptional regulator
MVSKDQAIGGAILTICILVAVCYSVAVFRPEFVMDLFGFSTASVASVLSFRIWVVTIPVFVAFITIMFIGAWIGWTMATTPPPKPIEEITTEIGDKKEVAPEENAN